MFTSDIAVFTRMAATRPGPIPAALQLHAATSAKDGLANGETWLHHEDTLLWLLQRDDLTDEVDALISTVNHVKVRANWCIRPGRTEEELLAKLSRERRITVLCSLAAQPAIPDAVYRKVLTRSTHQNVLLALIKNDAAPDDVRAEAVTELIADGLPDSKSFKWKAIRTDAVTASAAVRAHPTFDNFYRFYNDRKWAHPIRLDDTAVQLVHTLVTEILDTYIADLTKNPAAPASAELRQVMFFLSGTGVSLWDDAPDELIGQLEQITSCLAKRTTFKVKRPRSFTVIEQIIDRLRTPPTPTTPGDTPNATDDEPDTPTDTTPSGTDPNDDPFRDLVDNAIAAATNATTPDDIHTVLDDAKDELLDLDTDEPYATRWERVAPVVAAGLSNRAATVDLLTDWAPDLDASGLAAVAAAHNHDPAVGSALFADHPLTTLAAAFDAEHADFWLPFFLDRLPDDETPLSGYWSIGSLFDDVLDSLINDDIAVAVAPALPWSLFNAARAGHSSIWSPGNQRLDNLVDATLACLDAEFDGDPDMLENFMTFGATHQGTIGELIEIAKIHSEMSNVRRT